MNHVTKKIGALIAALVWSCGINAGSYGGYIIRTGSVDMQFDLKGAANPEKKPQIIAVSGSVDQIEYLCFNPSNFNVAPGSAGQRSLGAQGVVLTNANFIGKGQATVSLSYEVPPPFNCVNDNWTFIPDSEVAKSVSITANWYECTDETCLSYNTARPIDTLQLVCGLSPVQRNADGTVVKEQLYTCIDTTP